MGERNHVDETDRFLDSLTVEVAVPGDSAIRSWDLPDLPDSLAAATEAKLPPIEELFDYPVVVNRRVLTWIDEYLGRSRKTMNAGLRRSGRYLPMARRIFAEEGIPQDLVFLAHIESNFRPNARSRKSAYGLWQFMRGTAKMYGLRCDGLVDERLDPESSTRAAARLLRALHETYGDWYLALAAYNAGSGKVNRAIRRSGSSDFWEIAKTRHLRRETRNFVPAILAATILAKSPAAYGLTEETAFPIRYDTLTVRIATDLRVIAEAADLPLAQLAELNRALLYGQTPPNSSYVVRLPVGSREVTRLALAKIPPDQRLVVHRHRIRKGDTLYDLARQYGTTVRAIQSENGLGRSTLIRAGRTLRIPTRLAKGYAKSDRKESKVDRPLDTAPAMLASTAGLERAQIESDLGRGPSTAHIVEEARLALAAREDAEQVSVHVVRRGDTLYGIARRYDVPLSWIYRWNNLGPRSVIRPGQKIVTQKD
jgi:membrane-bound lytic murein transglycosylase D